ncbi:hypothetical protein BVC80_1651g109 [Macleaya cordata]|uniref:IQ motif n=1 Tax=Macleaya cordata TaxID=56857 RepID=A0A200PZF2_MACCD|nr:hypothetical protein BVC80_1651g109 [Macleaya cordata]
MPNFEVKTEPSFPFTLNLDDKAHELASAELTLAFNSLLVSSTVDDQEEYVTSESSVAPTPEVQLTKIDVQEEYENSTPLITMNQEKKSTVINGEESASLVSSVDFSSSGKSTEINGMEGEITAALKWQAIDYARLNYSTISFFNFLKPETAASRWNRISLNASKVGKGLTKDAKAKKLAFQHWIEAIDPRHRYGHSLHLYYDEWCKGDAGQPFFYWLDIGYGRVVDLKECPRSKLRQQCIKYLGPQEREHYEYIIVEGIILHRQSGEPMDTSKGSQGAKWIFVMSTSKKLYAGEKKKGMFHHSSFLAGGATLAAGRLVAVDGVLKSISAYSGHYRPTDENLDSFKDFLKENGVNLNEVQIRSSTDDYESYEEGKSVQNGNPIGVSTNPEPSQPEIPNDDVEKDQQPSEPTEVPPQTESKGSYRRTLSGGLQSPRAEVPKKAILQRINSKKAASSYQLGHQVSLKWSTGAGPRIGCVADYPMELRQQALEFVNLSPRTSLTPSASRQLAGFLPSSPRSTSDQ